MKMNPVLQLAVTALLWSFGGVLIKLVEWNAMAIAGMRAFFALLFLCIAFKRLPKFTARNEDGTINKIQTFDLIAGGILYAATQLLFVPATKLTTAANAIFLQYTNPIYVIIFGPLLLKEKNDWIDFSAVAGILIGMFFLLGGDFSGGSTAGNLLALGSGLTYGFTTLFLRRQRLAHPANSLILSNLFAFVMSIPFIAMSSMPSVKSCIGLVILGVFQIGLPCFFLAKGIRRVSAISSVVITMLEPMMNPVWVALFVGEIPSPSSIFGGIIILSFIVFHVAMKARKAMKKIQ